MTIVAGILATAAFAFSPQTVFAPHPCTFPFDDADGDGVTCDFDPDDHNDQCPVPQPETCPFEPEGFVRDNVNVHSIKLEEGQFMVIIDNAGIGGTSDVEVTWRFDPTKCVLIAAGFDITGMFTTVPLGNDMAFATVGVPSVAHDDIVHLEALLLGTVDDQACEIKPDDGNFITASTIASSGLGPLDLSSTPGLP